MRNDIIMPTKKSLAINT